MPTVLLANHTGEDTRKQRKPAGTNQRDALFSRFLITAVCGVADDEVQDMLPDCVASIPAMQRIVQERFDGALCP